MLIQDGSRDDCGHGRRYLHKHGMLPLDKYKHANVVSFTFHLPSCVAKVDVWSLGITSIELGMPDGLEADLMNARCST